MKEFILEYKTRSGFVLSWEQKYALKIQTDEWLCSCKIRKSFGDQITCNSKFYAPQLTKKFLEENVGKCVKIKLINAGHVSQGCEYSKAQRRNRLGIKTYIKGTKKEKENAIKDYQFNFNAIKSKQKSKQKPEPPQMNSSSSLVSQIAGTFELQSQFKSTLMNGNDFHFRTITESMFSVENFVFGANDFVSVRPNEMITDTIIDYVVDKIVRSKIAPKNNEPKIQIFTSIFFQTLMSSRYDDTGVTHDYDNIKQMFGATTITSTEYTMIVCCSGLHYWLMVVANPLSNDPSTEALILVLDSLGRKHSDEVDMLREYLNYEHSQNNAELKVFDDETLKLLYVPVPRQTNSNDCGVLLLKNIIEAQKCCFLGNLTKMLSFEQLYCVQSVQTNYRSKLLNMLIRLDSRYRSADKRIQSNIGLNWSCVDSLAERECVNDTVIDFYFEQLSKIKNGVNTADIHIMPVDFSTKMLSCANEKDFINLTKWVKIGDI